MKSAESAVTLLLLLFAAGCTPAANDGDEGPAKPKIVAFQGIVDPKFVGLWETDNDSSTLDIRKDGTVTIASSNPTPKGIQKLSCKGNWLVSGSNLVLKYRAHNQPEMTIQYPAVLTGSEMTLSQGGRSKMVYKLQAALKKK